MTPNQYRAAISRLGLTQAQAAQIFGPRKDPQTGHRWAVNGPPAHVVEKLTWIANGVLRLEDFPEFPRIFPEYKPLETSQTPVRRALIYDVTYDGKPKKPPKIPKRMAKNIKHYHW